MFKICARTVLELGAELISSDVIAFYELIKNAFDAKSPSGVEISFQIILRRNDYLKCRQRALDSSEDVEQLKKDVEKLLAPSAQSDSRERFLSLIKDANDSEALLSSLDIAYAKENKIIISDTGTGMSKQNLIDNYLVIGTASRKRPIDAVLSNPSNTSKDTPYLGEKGIGRLSAMRLGDRLTVETAEEKDSRLNLLEIDWAEFNNIDAMLDEIDVVPETGDEKPKSDWSGTRLIIGSLSADWTFDRVRQLGEHDFARLTDPFSDAKCRPRIAVYWNGTRVPVAHMDSHLLSQAHAMIKGKFLNGEKGPKLECEFEALDLGFEHSREVEKAEIDLADLEGFITGTSREIPITALYDLGEFEFEGYWYNRRNLGAVDSIGDKKQVQALQRRWSGILLFRDGFRVFPYGEDDDDWLGLDRRALGSSGYLLNKTQFVGRVNISRLGNPLLIDQTNREGLRVCPEQQALIGLLQFAIQDRLRGFLKDIQKRYKGQPIDMTGAKTDVSNLEKRAKAALRKIKRMTPNSGETVEELQHTFFEIKEFFDRAQNRITEVESENRQMMQIAGVGLLVEVVAHELARSTENTLSVLETLRDQNVPDQVEGLLNSLRSEMTAVSKRLRILDPLSVSGRQRKETFDLNSLINDTLSGHELQFERHNVELKVELSKEAMCIRAVKGMIIQIIENLISNSLYWLELRSEHERGFKPRITISMENTPLTITYEDNGRGISKENREKVFRAFFSLKEKSKRRGLGLYIARECAEYHGGNLVIDNNTNPETSRLHRFVLTLPDEVVVS